MTGGGGWLEKVHVTLDVVGTVASFVPGAGTVVAAVAEGVNATIYLAEAHVATDARVRDAALRNAAVSAACMVPLGKVITKTTKAIASTKPLAKHAQKVVHATEKAKVALLQTKPVRDAQRVVVQTLSHKRVAGIASKLDNFSTKAEKALERSKTLLPGKLRPKNIPEATFHIKNRQTKAAMRGVEKGSKEEARIQRVLGSNKFLRNGKQKPKYVSKAKRAGYDMQGGRTSAFEDFGRLQYEKQLLLSEHGVTALPYISRLEAQYFRSRAQSTLMHRGIPLAKQMGEFGLKKAAPVLDFGPWLAAKTWDAYSKQHHGQRLQSEAMPDLLSASDEMALRRAAVQLLRERGVAIDAANVATDELLAAAMVESALQQVVDQAGGEAGEDQEKQECEARAPEKQWPAIENQVYDFVTQLAGFLPPEQQPVANLILKVGGVASGLDTLTPESLVATLLPFIPNADVQKVVGTALKLRSLQQQVAGLSTASAAGQLATMQASLALVSTVLSLIPGVPPEVQQAIQMVTSVLKLAQLLSVGAPPLLVLGAILAIVQLSMGFGRSKMVDGGTNNSGSGRPHNRPGGRGPHMQNTNLRNAGSARRYPGGSGAAGAAGVAGAAGAADDRSTGDERAGDEKDEGVAGDEQVAGNDDMADEEQVAGDELVQGDNNQQADDGKRVPDDGYEQGDGSFRMAGMGGLHSQVNSSAASRSDSSGGAEARRKEATGMEEAVSRVSEAMGLGSWEANDIADLQDGLGSRDAKGDVHEERCTSHAELIRKQQMAEMVRDLMGSRGDGDGPGRQLQPDTEGRQQAAFDSREAAGGPLRAQRRERREDASERSTSDAGAGDQHPSDDVPDMVLKDAEMTVSADISAIVASELALLADEETEHIFWAKFVNHALVSQSQVRSEMLETAEREMEERELREEAAIAKKERELEADCERRQKLNREWEEAMSLEQQQRRENRINEERRRMEKRLREDAEAQERWNAEQRAIAERQQQERKKELKRQKEEEDKKKKEDEERLKKQREEAAAKARTKPAPRPQPKPTPKPKPKPKPQPQPKPQPPPPQQQQSRRKKKKKCSIM